MRENMQYAHFCKICEICCDRMIAINRYPYLILSPYDSSGRGLPNCGRVHDFRSHGLHQQLAGVAHHQCHLKTLNVVSNMEPFHADEKPQQCGAIITVEFI